MLEKIDKERSWKALQLASLAYEEKETIQKWVDGGMGDIIGGKVWFESQVRQEDIKGIRAVYFGFDPVGNFHKAQWIAGECDNTLYIAFKGTDNATDFFLDSSLSDVLTPNGTRLHSGFYSGIQQEFPLLLSLCNTYKCTDIVFCGHSLGGAYATVACLELQASLLWDRGLIGQAITFGMPLTVCGSSEDGPPVLPSRISLTPPKMTHFIANYDAVPRLLALKRNAAIGFLEEIPMLIAAGPLSTVVALAKRAGYAKADAIVDNTQHLRACFRCVGTYVMCTSVFANGVRTASFTVVPPEDEENGGVWNQAAMGHLRFFPPFEASAQTFTEGGSSAARQEVVKQSISDHYLAPSYWVVLDQMRNMSRNMNSGLVKRKVNPTKPIQDALVSYDPFSSLGVVVPNDEILKNMTEEDQKSWERLLADLQRLSKAATHARDMALAKHSSPTPPDSPRQVKQPDPVVAAVVNCVVSTSPEPSAAEKMKKKAAQSKVYVVNLIKGEGVTVNLGDYTEKVAYKASCGLNALAGDLVRLTTNPDKFDVEVKLPITVRGEKRVLVVEMSGAGLVVWDYRIRDVSKDSGWLPSMGSIWDKKKKPEEKTEADFESEKVTAFYPNPMLSSRALHLHALSQYLENADVTYNAFDKAPRGMGVAEGAWSKAEACSICTTKFTHFGRHHCRECGESVCKQCSPGTYYNALSPQAPVRICKTCHKRLFPYREETEDPGTLLLEADEDNIVVNSRSALSSAAQPQW